MDAISKFGAAVSEAIKNLTLRKITFSRYDDKSVIRSTARLFDNKGQTFLQIERFTSDGKALHRNIPVDSALPEVISELDICHRINLTCTDCHAELMRSEKGKISCIVTRDSAAHPVIAQKPLPHDRRKSHILYDGTPYDFLIALGVADADGRVFDKYRPKFRQIDRFLQYIDDVYAELPHDGTLYVLDLCCGKSYLTFAAYWFLTAVKGRKVSMTGVDRKEDVIRFCSETAAALGYSGLNFLCCNINGFIPAAKPALVLSLHACDVATDIVLTAASRLEADVILSTPCCQHEIMNQLSTASPLGSSLKPILDHSLLGQKLAVALTDALRCKRLQASGYEVTVTELIDPEDTPKNIMIRAVRKPMSDELKKRYRDEFTALSAGFNINLYGGI